MFKRLRTQILKMLLDSRFETAITEDDDLICITAIEHFKFSDHSDHCRTICITVTEEVK